MPYDGDYNPLPQRRPGGWLSRMVALLRRERHAGRHRAAEALNGALRA